MMYRLIYEMYHRVDPKKLGDKKAFVQEMQWWPQERILDWQWAKIKDLLEHSQKTVPYYQDLFKKLGFETGDIRSLDDFSHLPILTKEAIQMNPDRLLAVGAKAVERRTGGSTGKPLRFYRDAEYTDWAHTSLYWGFNLCGFTGGEKQVFLWGSDYDARLHETFKGRMLDRVQNVRFIDAFRISTQQLGGLAKELHRHPPDFIWGYVSTLELLAEQALKDGIRFRPRGVQSTAGTLYPSVREKLERAFGNVIYDRYGSREVSIIAHECGNHQGLHIAAFHNYVEIVGGDGIRPGRIVITNLHNKAFPFIRYSIEDLGIPDSRKCGCGRSLPLLKRIVGRTVEVITSPSGNLIDGSLFTYVFDHSEGVERFQVVQESRDLLVIKIVKGKNFKEDVLSFLERKIKEHGDPDFQIRFEFVDQIPDLISGKRAYVISKIPVFT